MKIRKFSFGFISLLGFLSILFAGWMSLFPNLYLNPSVYWSNDSITDQYTLFNYLVQTLKWNHTLPDWHLNRYGGFWLKGLVNNHVLSMPYRWIGIAVGALTSFPTNLVFKLSFVILGVGSFLIGVYYLVLRLTGSKAWALLALTCTFFSPAHVSMFHHEQLLSTIYFLPFQWLCLLKTKENGRWYLPFAVLLGLNIHCLYPHYPLIYWGVVGICFGLRSLFRREALFRKVDLFPILMSISILILFFIPLLWTYRTLIPVMNAPFRGQLETIQTFGYQEFLELNQLQNSSFHPLNFLSLFAPGPFDWQRIGHLDRNAIYVGPAFLLSLVGIFLVRVPYGWLLYPLMGVLALSAMGVYTPLIYFYWYTLPGIKFFRQWYGFLQPFNFHALLWTLLVVKSLKEKFLSEKKHAFALVSTALVSGFFLSAVFICRDFERFFQVSNLEIPEHSRLASQTEQQFLESLFWYGPIEFFERDKPLVSPKGLNPTVLDVINRGRNLFWVSGRSLDPVLPTDLEVKAIPYGFRFKALRVPKTATGLFLVQFDDGNWKARNILGKAIPLIKNPTKILSFPLVPGSTIEVVRDFDIFPYLSGILFWILLPVTLIYCRSSHFARARSLGTGKTMAAIRGRIRNTVPSAVPT